MKKRYQLVTGVGLLVVGLLLAAYLAWVGYVQPHQRQEAARQEFVQVTVAIMPTATPTITPTKVPAVETVTVMPTVTVAAAPTAMPTPTSIPDPEDFLLEIPKINLAWVIREVPSDEEAYLGISKEELDRWGALRSSWYVYPGEVGVVVIAGHRDISGAPFLELNRLEVGDRVEITPKGGAKITYIVTDWKYVDPDALWVLEPSGEGIQDLRLVTCMVGSTAQRLVIFAETQRTVD